MILPDGSAATIPIGSWSSRAWKKRRSCSAVVRALLLGGVRSFGRTEQAAAAQQRNQQGGERRAADRPGRPLLHTGDVYPFLVVPRLLVANEGIHRITRAECLGHHARRPCRCDVVQRAVHRHHLAKRLIVRRQGAGGVIESRDTLPAGDALAKLAQHGLGIGPGLVKVAHQRALVSEEKAPSRGELPFMSFLERPREDQLIRVGRQRFVADSNRRDERVARAREERHENKADERGERAKLARERPHHGASADDPCRPVSSIAVPSNPEGNLGPAVPEGNR